MSTYPIAIRFSPALRELRLRGAGTLLLNWWLGLYAEPPRKLRPLI